MVPIGGPHFGFLLVGTSSTQLSDSKDQNETQSANIVWFVCIQAINCWRVLNIEVGICVERAMLLNPSDKLPPMHF